MANFLDLTGLTHFWSKVKAYVDGAVSAAKTTVGNYTINGQKISSNPTILGNVTNDAQVKRSEMGVKNGVATLNENGKVPSSQLPMFMDDALEFETEIANSASITIKQASTGKPTSIVYLRDKDVFVASITPEGGLGSPEYYSAWGETDKIKVYTDYGTPVQGKGVTPKDGVIYANLGNAKNYRYAGSSAKLVASGSDLALGETSSTAFRGDYGKIAYNHAQAKGVALSTEKLYKITTNSEGHVTKGTAVTKNDITALGIPAQDTTYGIATTSTAGLVKPSSVIAKPSVNSPSTEEGKYYHVQMSSDGAMFVNVPWQNTPGPDTKVTQKATSSNGAFNLLLAQTSGNTSEETGSVNKASGLTYNPSTKALSTGGAVTASGAITGSTIKKSGGTSSQILMADGSVATAIPTEAIDSLFS